MGLFFSIACTKENNATSDSGHSEPKPDRAIIAPSQSLESKFIQEWIEMMQSPYLPVTSEQRVALCQREVVELEINRPLTCVDAIDLSKLSESFEATCDENNVLSLKLKPKSQCSLATLELLKQKQSSGPLKLNGQRLEPNVISYPLLAQVPPIVFSDTDKNAAHIALPTAEAWLKTLASTGAVLVSLRPARASSKSLESLARVLANLETARKFSPQVKFGGPPSNNLVPESLNQIQISWVDGETSDPLAQRICDVITGWIDFQMLQVPKTQRMPVNYELKCILALDRPIETLAPKNDIEIGRLAFPLVLSKSGTYLFSTLSEALSPSALLGLRLDL